MKSKYEVDLWKQRYSYQHLPDSLKVLQLPLPSTLLINNITDADKRQYLVNRYQKINEHAKEDMMKFYITIAITKMGECLTKFNNSIVQMRSSRALSKEMTCLLEERFKTMDKRFEQLYNLKISVLEQQKKT